MCYLCDYIGIQRPPSLVTADALLSTKDKLKPTEVQCGMIYEHITLCHHDILTDSRTSHPCGWH